MIRVGIGYDAHQLLEGIPLVLGGVTIPHPSGLSGHSDGDALMHAVTDALLGAIGAPDIGSLFPSSDPQWKGASSIRFLDHAQKLAAEKGFELTQMDSVILAQKPQLAPFIPAMKQVLSEILAVTPDVVGIKATTTDRMGFVGRTEGIAAQAVVLVSQKAGG